MTAPAPVSAPATPVSAPATPIAGHWQVTAHRCLTISCAICGLDAWDEYVVHFDSEYELWEWVSTQGWTIRRDGNVLCAKHSADADCAEHGHHWDDWIPLPGHPNIQYRCCERCSAGDERRIDRQRRRCASSGSTAHGGLLPVDACGGDIRQQGSALLQPPAKQEPSTVKSRIPVLQGGE